MSSFADTEQYIYRNVGSMLGQRRRRWLDIEPSSFNACDHWCKQVSNK